MKRIIASPGSYIQGEGELGSLADYYVQLGKKGAYILIDQFIYNNYLVKIASSFIEENIPYQAVVFGGECSMDEINKHIDQLKDCDAVTMPGGHVSLGAFALATLCRDTLLTDGLKAKAAAEQQVVTKAFENVVEANTYLSSIGFESSGLAAAHAIHDGLTVLPETHNFLHGEKVAFGTVTQLVLENKPLDELSEIVTFLHQCDLPVCMKDLGIENVNDKQLLLAAENACSPDDTMGNMPFDVTPQDIVSAMKTTDGLTKMILGE